MIKYAKVVNEETKAVEVGLGTNIDFYKSLGMTEMDVEQAWDGNWYLAGYAPIKPEPALEEQLIAKEHEYEMNRWQREGILAEGSAYSDYAKARAQELEDLAEQIRNQNVGGDL